MKAEGTGLDLAIAAESEISKRRPDPKLDRYLHELSGGEVGDVVPDFTSDLDAAMTLIPAGWWWHLSHLECSMIPTSSHPDIPISNGTDYTLNGRPISYSFMLFGDSKLLALGVCAAFLRAYIGLALKAKAKAEQRLFLVQTGSGPVFADMDGSLKDLPHNAWINDEGELVGRREAFPSYKFVEPKPEDCDLE